MRHFTQKNRLEELRRRRNEGRSYDRVQLLWFSGSTLGHGVLAEQVNEALLLGKPPGCPPLSLCGR